MDSAVVRMVPREAPVALDSRLLEELVQVAFSQRRKLLRHTLGRWLEARAFAEVSMYSAAPRKCPCTNTWRWRPACRNGTACGPGFVRQQAAAWLPCRGLPDAVVPFRNQGGLHFGAVLEQLLAPLRAPAP